MNWEDLVPDGAVKGIAYAGCVFWYDEDNEIIFKERYGAERFQQWVQEKEKQK